MRKPTAARRTVEPPRNFRISVQFMRDLRRTAVRDWEKGPEVRDHGI
jgi:hypothetical protein